MILTTERLLLREFTMDDVPSLYALESIPEVVRYQTYGPRTPDQAREVVAEIVRGQGETPRRHVELAVFHEDAFLGRVGAWIEAGTAALWYAFLPGAQGRGYATEAVGSLIPTLDTERLTIECDPRNEASWRLAERLGFARESLTERAYECKGEWVDSLVYTRTPLPSRGEGLILREPTTRDSQEPSIQAPGTGRSPSLGERGT